MKKKHDTEWCAINSHLQLKQNNMHVRKFKDTKGVIRSYKSKDRQHNGQRNKAKRTNNDLQKIMQKTKDWITWTPLKTRGGLGGSRSVSSCCSTCGTCCVTNPVISHKWGKVHIVNTTLNIFMVICDTDTP